MKRFAQIAFLAVAFIALWVCQSKAESFRLESRVISICGEKSVVTESINENGIRKVVDVVDIPKVTIPQKKVAKVQQSTISLSIPKASDHSRVVVEVKAPVKVSETVSAVWSKSKKRIFVANGETRQQFFGEGGELKAIDAWIAEKKVTVQVPASATTEITNTKTTIAPKNTGASDITKNCQTEAPQSAVAEVPNQHGQTEVTKAVPQSAVAEVPNQQGREVKMAYYQWPQKNPEGNGWQEVGSVLNRINPHTALPENIEKPIQQTLIWAESASGQVFVRPVFGPMGSCPKGLEEIKPIKTEKKESLS